MPTKTSLRSPSPRSCLAQLVTWLGAGVLCAACDSVPQPAPGTDASSTTRDLAGADLWGTAPDLAGARPDGAMATGPDFSKVVPWKAVDFVGPSQIFWYDYDYRPKAQGGHKEDIDATLVQLKADGVRQVQIQTLYACSIEASTVLPNSGGIRSVVYYDPKYKVTDPTTWGKVPRQRRGDMGIMPYEPPAFWDQPTVLNTPLDFDRHAQQVLGQMLDAVYAHGLIPVLKFETYLVVATDVNDDSGDFNYTDPSRNFDQFYAQYLTYAVNMTKLAAAHHAALVILGTETPYVAGAGQVNFISGESMTSRAGYIYSQWKNIIQTARQTAAAAGRPDMLFSYTEINPWWEPRAPMQPAPIWTRIQFWDDLDVVGINYYMPGRLYLSDTNYDKAPRTAAEMESYEETHNFDSDTVANLQDLKAYFVGQKGYSLTTKPVIFPEDGCTSTKYGAANPAQPPALRVRGQPDFTDQTNLFTAHFQQADKYGAGWLAGTAFWQVTPNSAWGGPWNPANTDNYQYEASYFNFLNNPAEAVVKAYFTR